MLSFLKNKDTAKILINTIWMIFDKVFILILGLFVTVRIANYYGALGYGNYQYAVNTVAIFEILVTLVDGRVVKKKYYDHDANTIVFAATVSRILFSVISAVIGIAFVWTYREDTELSLMFSILLVNAIINNLKFGMANRFEFLLKSKKIVIASDIGAVVGAVLQLVAVNYHWSICVISIIALISTIVNIFIIYVQYKMEFREKIRCPIDRNLLKEMIKESIPLAIAASCSTIYTRSDSVMLGTMLSSTEVGIYAISVKLISIVQIVVAPVRESVYPKLIILFNTDKKAYERQYVRITSALTWIYICGVSLSIFVLPYAFRFLNTEYAEAFPVYCIHVLGTFFVYNSALRAGHYTLINRGEMLMYSQIISVIANVVMNVIGIHLWGMYGAALATIITQAVSLFFSNLLFGEQGKEVFRWQLRALNPMRIVK